MNRNERTPATCLRRAQIENPSLSVIVPMYNAACFIRRTLASILSQKTPSMELILVDDASTDSSLLEAMCEFNPCLTILTHSENRGAAAARNTGAHSARSDWLCFFDADDVMLPDSLGPYFQAVTAQKDKRWAYCRLSIVDETRACHGMQMGRPFDLIKFLETNITCNGMSLHHRDLFMKTGGYDSNLDVGEDYSLFLRYIEWSDPFYYDQVCFHYIRHLANITRAADPSRHRRIHESCRVRIQTAGENDDHERRRRLLRSIYRLQDGVKMKQWHVVLKEASFLNSAGFSSVGLDISLGMSLHALGQYESEWTLVMKRLHRTAHGERLDLEDLNWMVCEGLDIGMAMNQVGIVTTFVSMAQTGMSGLNDERLRSTLLQATRFLEKQDHKHDDATHSGGKAYVPIDAS